MPLTKHSGFEVPSGEKVKLCCLIFVSCEEPPSPESGQLWWNGSNLKIWDGAWKILLTGLSKHRDSGVHTITTSKSWEPVVFHDTFPTVPAVVVTKQDVAGGKKVGQRDATTTGFDITAEATGDCDWIAREQGYE